MNQTGVASGCWWLRAARKRPSPVIGWVGASSIRFSDELESVARRIDGGVDLRPAVRGGNEPRLFLRGRQHDPRLEHGVEEAREAPVVIEEDSEQRSNAHDPHPDSSMLSRAQQT